MTSTIVGPSLLGGMEVSDLAKIEALKDEIDASSDLRRAFAISLQTASLRVSPTNVLLRREGIVANHKRIYRVYAAAKLQVRKRVKRRVALGRGEAITPASQPNVRWSLDFVHDTLQNGRRIRTLNVVDDFTRESITIEVDTSIAGARVARVLDRILGGHFKPYRAWPLQSVPAWAK